MLELLSLLVYFLVGGTEKVDIIVVLLSISLGGFGTSGGRRTVSGVLLGGVSGEGLVFGRVRLDVLVPTSGVGVGSGGRSGRESLEDSNVGLRGSVSIESETKREKSVSSNQIDYVVDSSSSTACIRIRRLGKKS